LWYKTTLAWETVLPMDAPGANGQLVKPQARPTAGSVRVDLSSCLNDYFKDDIEKFPVRPPLVVALVRRI
jgi:hypothetical protein